MEETGRVARSHNVNTVLNRLFRVKDIYLTLATITRGPSSIAVKDVSKITDD